MPFVTTTGAGVPIQGPSATLIYDDWYPALRTDGLRNGKLAKGVCLRCATRVRTEEFR